MHFFAIAFLILSLQIHFIHKNTSLHYRIIHKFISKLGNPIPQNTKRIIEKQEELKT